MPAREVHRCQCPACQHPDPHPDQPLHAQMNLLLSRLDEQQRRWYAALESHKLGHGGDTTLALITGLHVDTIRRGREELAAGLRDRPTDRVRNPGGGRRPVKKRTRTWSRLSWAWSRTSPAVTPRAAPSSSAAAWRPSAASCPPAAGHQRGRQEGGADRQLQER